MSRPLRARPTIPALIFVVGLLLFTAGCTTSDDAQDRPAKLPTGTVDTTEQGFDPSDQVAKANDLRLQLEQGGIDCKGDAKPPDLGADDIQLGVVAQLSCPVDGVQIQIAMYRTQAAKKAGISRLGWLACMNKVQLDYVDGTSWVVGAMPHGTSGSDPAMTDRIAGLLDAPVRSVPC